MHRYRFCEDHRYDRAIARGAWVDASELKPGYRLLNDGGTRPVHAPGYVGFEPTQSAGRGLVAQTRQRRVQILRHREILTLAQ